MTEHIQAIELQRIDVGRRHRAFREDAIAELAGSIRQLGLLNPLRVVEINGRYRLVAGLHRLEACRSLGWSEVPAIVLDADELDAELVEIDENLIRRGLSVLEEAEHLARRDEILAARGQRAQAGDNQHMQQSGGGASSAPPLTTAAIAAQMGMSERTAQERMQIARGLPEEVRDAIRGTETADSRSSLLALATMDDERTREAVVELIASGEAASVWQAERQHKLHSSFTECKSCGEAIRKSQRHCDGCGAHEPGSHTVCEKCGLRLRLEPGQLAIRLGPAAPQSSDIVGTLPEPFKRKGGHADTRVMLPAIDEGDDTADKPSELALRFADTVDALTAVNVSALTAEAGSPVVQYASKKLGRWVDQLRSSLESAATAGQGQPAP